MAHREVNGGGNSRGGQGSNSELGGRPEGGNRDLQREVTNCVQCWRVRTEARKYLLDVVTRR